MLVGLAARTPASRGAPPVSCLWCNTWPLSASWERQTEGRIIHRRCWATAEIVRPRLAWLLHRQAGPERDRARSTSTRHRGTCEQATRWRVGLFGQRFHRCCARRRRALLITLTDERAMAAAAIIGESRRPNGG